MLDLIDATIAGEFDAFLGTPTPSNESPFNGISSYAGAFHIE